MQIINYNIVAFFVQLRGVERVPRMYETMLPIQTLFVCYVKLSLVRGMQS